MKLGVVVPSIAVLLVCFFFVLLHPPWHSHDVVPNFLPFLSFLFLFRSFVRSSPSESAPRGSFLSFPAFLKGLESAPSLPFPFLSFFLSCLSYSLSLLLGLGFQVGCLLGFLSAAALVACQTPSSLTWHSAIGSPCPPQHLPGYHMCWTHQESRHPKHSVLKKYVYVYSHTHLTIVKLFFFPFVTFCWAIYVGGEKGIIIYESNLSRLFTRHKRSGIGCIPEQGFQFCFG